MKRLILAMAFAIPSVALAKDQGYQGTQGNTPSELTPEKKAEYKDLHKTEPPKEAGEVSPTTKLRAKKAVNWPGNLGEQYDLQGDVSTKGQTHDEKTGRVVPRDTGR
jgi:hypothetical protein